MNELELLTFALNGIIVIVLLLFSKTSLRKIRKIIDILYEENEIIHKEFESLKQTIDNSETKNERG